MTAEVAPATIPRPAAAPARPSAPDRAVLGPDRFRAGFGELPTGVTVVTTGGPAGRAGLTASSVTSVSLDPLLVLVCVHNRSASLGVLLGNGRFAVNVLRDTQLWVSSRFAERLPGPEKFASVAHRLVNDGLPVLEGVVLWVTCGVAGAFPAGDHTIVLGAVSDMGGTGGQPLVRHAGRYRRLGDVA